MTGPIDDAVRVSDGGDVPDVLDQIVAETRDYTPAQCQARLAELGGFTRLSGRQRVEQSLLAERVQTAERVMSAYQSGNTGMFDQVRPAPGGTLAGGEAGHGGWVTSAGPGPHVQAHRTNAMRVLDHYKHTGVLDAAAADRADKVLRHGDGQGLTARYLAACGNPDYAGAFGKMLADPVMGHNRFTSAEVEAMREMTAAHEATKIMGAIGTGSTGFPLPITWDPSITITGTGALNPVRDLADVVMVGTHDWQGITSDSVTATYVAEGTEALDATPTLVGPKISSQQGRAFVPLTIEATMDWDTVAQQMAQMIADAKNTLDATKFLLGSGTNEPSGILNIGALNGLTTTQRVQTATIATYAAGDNWLLKGAIPARFIPTSTFAAAPATWDTAWQFVAAGSTTQARQFDSGRGDNFLGRPKVEWSTMGTGATTGTKLMIVGNFKGYKVVDRLAGVTVEVIPHLFSTANARPIGTRGLYAYWRTGAGVISPNHFRYLEVK
jgi:HK97 family phage major capsid protein